MQYFRTFTLKDGRSCTIRNGNEQDGQQLLDKTEYAFGRITERTVLYNGETIEEENGIHYQIIQEYLNSL